MFSHTLEMRGPKLTSLTLGDRRVSVYRIGDRPGNDFFYDEYAVPQLKYRTVGELITTDTEKKRIERSVIAMLDELKDATDNQAEPERASDQEILEDIKEIGW